MKTMTLTETIDSIGDQFMDKYDRLADLYWLRWDLHRHDIRAGKVRRQFIAEGYNAETVDSVLSDERERILREIRQEKRKLEVEV